MKKIIISEINAGERIDKFLMEEVFFNSEISRGELVRNINSGNILVNKKVIKPSYILKAGDEAEVSLQKKAQKLSANPKVKFEILHQDKNIIAINKPAGLSVHPINFENKNTLVNGLLAKFPEIENINDKSIGSELRPGIVHRLDKDTSGVMVVARTQEVFDELKKIFQDRKASKKYLALVSGKMENKKGLIEKSLARSASYKKQIIAHRKTKTKIRPAVTEYEVIKQYADCALIEVLPKTGRTHQIRIHLSSIGHPIVGDLVYGDKKSKVPAGRQLLHAQSLEFELLGKKYAFKADLPADFTDFLGSLDEDKKKG